MQVDPKYFREHYSSLSDEALLSTDRAGLVEAAQKCYDEEMDRRELKRPRNLPRTVQAPAVGKGSADLPADDESGNDPPYSEDNQERPDWFNDAAEAYSQTVLPGTAPAPQMVNARDALIAAGVPCYLELAAVPGEESRSSSATQYWRLLVPGHLNLQATSILERDIFNEEFEGQWKTHLEALPDDQLLDMQPEAVFCGLYDRIERVNRAYDEEIARRGLSRDDS